MPAVHAPRAAIRRRALARCALRAEDAVIATLNPFQEPTMNTARSHRLVAFTLSLVTTFVIFSGVVSLSSPEHAGMLLDGTPAAHTEKA
jgi:hypothetical protein